MLLDNSAFRLHSTADYFMCSGNGLECFLKASQPAVVFFHPPWRVGIRYAFRLALIIKALEKQHIEVIVCCNENGESILLNKLGVTAYHLNQNLHLPENVYRPMDGFSQAYDAIYVAQAKKFKRMHLARDVKRLYILTYSCKFRTPEGGYDLHAFEPRLSHCDYNREFIRTNEEICQLYAKSVCGLALSKKEGAMWASMEYLMSGIPVVTTKNTGGRDQYLDSECAIWVKPTVASVREGVEFFVKNPPDRQAIRESVLVKVKKERRNFLIVLNTHLSKNGCSETSEDYIWGGSQGILELHQPIFVEDLNKEEKAQLPVTTSSTLDSTLNIS